MQNKQVKSVEVEIVKALATVVPDRFSDHSAIDDHQDLLEFVDSFGFVQLLMSIEAPLDIELDLTSVDLGSIVRFGDLVAFIGKSSNKTLASKTSASALVDIA